MQNYLNNQRNNNNTNSPIVQAFHAGLYSFLSLTPPSTEITEILISRNSPGEQLRLWKPVFITPDNEQVSLQLEHFFPFSLPLDCCFVLPDKFKVDCTLSRSYYNIVKECANYHHPFVFNYPEPPMQDVFFAECARLKRSVVISNIREKNSDTLWELHLKPTVKESLIFGYICKPDHLYRKVAEKVDDLMERRKLPLVLDLDDTLVRYLPDPEIAEYIKKTPHRVKTLKDGRKIVLVEKVHEFLDWAQRFFEISICTIGDQNYLEMVREILDPTHTRIKTIYSARYEYESILRSSNPQRPAKDLGSLFSFCVTRNENRNQPGTGNSLPLILDDNITAWPIEQHDNIIVVRETRNSPLWNVSLYPVVQNTLQAVYNSFFKQLDIYSSGQTKIFPSCVRCYKEYLRWELSQKISDPFNPYPSKNIPPPLPYSVPSTTTQPPIQPPPSSLVQPLPTSLLQTQAQNQNKTQNQNQSSLSSSQSPPTSQNPSYSQPTYGQPPLPSSQLKNPSKAMQSLYYKNSNYNNPPSQQQVPKIV
ncbi:hypothetical protein BCR32DRAFT_227797 [Anaeromyces robustus]|uniref:protein-serine/threonine phosphatase n=1 Tax=Anaeromyces robustus TaxID=1754192 RepID=A0A1Y1XPS7_9FUNG|nr:hypothetical protein BCR32DRAFT_227797 [Anaeromyces robustus]|eukprot:ORX87665.1 hypothetical protein BCR32DRAFT_227797 [Anaeromyces robustus]